MREKLEMAFFCAIWLAINFWPSVLVVLILEAVIGWDFSLHADFWMAAFAAVMFVIYQLIAVMDGDEDGLTILGGWLYNRRRNTY